MEGAGVIQLLALGLQGHTHLPNTYLLHYGIMRCRGRTRTAICKRCAKPSTSHRSTIELHDMCVVIHNPGSSQGETGRLSSCRHHSHVMMLYRLRVRLQCPWLLWCLGFRLSNIALGLLLLTCKQHPVSFHLVEGEGFEPSLTGVRAHLSLRLSANLPIHFGSRPYRPGCPFTNPRSCPSAIMRWMRCRGYP